MFLPNIRNRDFSREIIFNASRSGGPGGQNVNKVNSKVELRFHIGNSNELSDEEKALLTNSLSNSINSKGELLIVSQTERTQLRNKERCLIKFFFLIEKGLLIKKKRRPTQPSKISKVKRLEKKKAHSNKKNIRRQTYNED
jgi:ribosome-associated protein